MVTKIIDKSFSKERISNKKNLKGITNFNWMCYPDREITDISVTTEDCSFDMEKFISFVTNKGIPDGYVGRINVDLGGVAVISTCIDSYGRVLRV